MQTVTQPLNSQRGSYCRNMAGSVKRAPADEKGFIPTKLRNILSRYNTDNMQLPVHLSRVLGASTDGAAGGSRENQNEDGSHSLHINSSMVTVASAAAGLPLLERSGNRNLLSHLLSIRSLRLPLAGEAAAVEGRRCVRFLSTCRSLVSASSWRDSVQSVLHVDPHLCWMTSLDESVRVVEELSRLLPDPDLLGGSLVFRLAIGID
ncbi:hypothetical protein EYF80_030875 [Liparis tanakae]|uniref:Uncharacterized protein n=1 Tax=Liparis tanakae TaxID=230148 RepID=A0A4Z2H259_9TELE|nr:hypothetical protein EYF80_030875 [Liparis tanakae]